MHSYTKNQTHRLYKKFFLYLDMFYNIYYLKIELIFLMWITMNISKSQIKNLFSI